VQVAVGVLLMVAGLAVSAAGWTGLRGTLRRNRFVGVRTAASMSSDRAFAAANRVAAPALLAAGGIAVLGGAAAIAAPSGLAFAVVVVVTAVGLLALALVGGSLGARAALSVTASTQRRAPCAGCACGGPGTSACADYRT
jgi:uncharacterized membrane protein